MCCLSAKEA